MTSVPSTTHIHFLEDIGAGGLETRIEELRRADDSRNTHVIAAPGSLEQMVTRFWGGEFRALPATPSPALSIMAAMQLQTLLARWSDESSRTLVHTHTPMPAILAAATSGLKGLHVHTIHGPGWIPWTGEGRLVFNHVLQNLADRVVIVSEELDDRLMAFGLRRQALILRNVDVLARPDPTNTAPGAQRMSRKGGPKRMAFAGRLVPEKTGGLVAFIDLIRNNMGTLALDIYGEGPELEVLRDRAKGLLKSGNVRFKGVNMGFAGVVRQYSVILGEGRVTLEALAAGVPAFVLGPEPGVFVTHETLEALLYANGSFRGVKKPRMPTAEELCAPPPPPPLPAPVNLTEFYAQLIAHPAEVAPVEKIYFRTRTKAIFRVLNRTVNRASEALDFAYRYGLPDPVPSEGLERLE